MSSSADNNCTLKEALNYREKCLIHGKPFTPYSLGIEGYESKMTVSKFGIHLISKWHKKYDCESDFTTDLVVLRARTNENGVNFKYDGTYECNNNKCPKWLTTNPVQVHMRCYLCAIHPLYNRQGLGYSTIDNIFIKQHYYSFTIRAGLTDPSTILLQKETIHHMQDGKFYHIEADLTSNQAVCRMGSADKSQTLDNFTT